MTKTIFVTGGSRGIGEAIVRRAAGKYNVCFTYNANEGLARDLEKELAGLGVVTVKCDVRDENSVKSAVEFAKKRFGRIDVLVNNAGVSKSGLLIDLDEKDWDDVFDVNVKGVFRMTKAVLPDMLARRSGAVVNVSSIWGQVGASCEVAYSSSKAAVIGFTKALAKEVAPSGIRVNCVSPGFIMTEMNSRFSDEDLELIKEDIPLGIFGEPRHIADAVAFLASGSAEYITGQVLAVNGGMVI